jgi:hypothetical protein
MQHLKKLDMTFKYTNVNVDGWMDGSTLFKNTLIFSTILMLVSPPLITYDV